MSGTTRYEVSGTREGHLGTSSRLVDLRKGAEVPDWFDLISEDSSVYWEATPLDHISLKKHRPVQGSDDESCFSRSGRCFYHANSSPRAVVSKATTATSQSLFSARGRSCLSPWTSLTSSQWGVGSETS